MPEAPRFNATEPDFERIHAVGPGLYTFVTRFSFEGKAPVQNRSVIVHRSSPKGRGELVIINPAELTPTLLEQLRQLESQLAADVKSLISPGDWHYLFIGDYVKAFPLAEAWVCPGRVPGKNPAFPFKLIDVAGGTLKQWAPELLCRPVEGLKDFSSPDPKMPRHELFFFHPASEALIAGDVLWYVKGELEPHHKHLGIQKGVLSFHFAQWKMVLDAKAVRRSFDEALKWDFKHFITIHGGPGNMLENEAKQQLGASLDWMNTGPS